MIKNIPIIYPNELFYSFICRTYVRSGVGSSKEFTKLVFAKGTDQPKTGFINKLKNDFKIKLNKQLSDIDILSKHTVFNFYSRFLTKEEKEKAISEIINGKSSFNYLHTPVIKENTHLRYCSKCVEEDRNNYGEAYFHIEHQLEKVRVCVHHQCKLLGTKIFYGCKNQLILTPLEVCELENKVEEVPIDSIEFRFSKYIYEFLKYEFNVNSNVGFEKLLTDRLDDNYFLSARRERKNLDLIYEDLAKFYEGYELFSMSRRRLAAILRGIEYNTFDILLISFFEGIRADELCNLVNINSDKSEEFDKKVIELHTEGNSYLKISQMMNVDKETIRKIILRKKL